LEELALAQYLDAFTGYAAGDVTLAIDRSAEPHEPREQSCPSSRQSSGDDDHNGEDRGPSDHRREHTRGPRTLDRFGGNGIMGAPTREELAVEQLEPKRPGTLGAAGSTVSVLSLAVQVAAYAGIAMGLVGTVAR